MILTIKLSSFAYNVFDGVVDLDTISKPQVGREGGREGGREEGYKKELATKQHSLTTWPSFPPSLPPSHPSLRRTN